MQIQNNFFFTIINNIIIVKFQNHTVNAREPSLEGRRLPYPTVASVTQQNSNASPKLHRPFSNPKENTNDEPTKRKVVAANDLKI